MNVRYTLTSYTNVLDEDIHAMPFGPLCITLINNPQVYRVFFTCYGDVSKTLKVWARPNWEEDAWMHNAEHQKWEPAMWTGRSGKGMTEGVLGIRTRQGAMHYWLQEASADLALKERWHVTVGA
jgi:hypothetical protein